MTAACYKLQLALQNVNYELPMTWYFVHFSFYFIVRKSFVIDNFPSYFTMGEKSWIPTLILKLKKRKSIQFHESNGKKVIICKKQS